MRRGMTFLRDSALEKVFAGITTLKEITRSHSLSKGLAEQITEVFKPQGALWACELDVERHHRPGVNRHRNGVTAKIASEMPAGTVASSYSETNIAMLNLRDPRQAGFRSGRIRWN